MYIYIYNAYIYIYIYTYTHIYIYIYVYSLPAHEEPRASPRREPWPRATRRPTSPWTPSRALANDKSGVFFFPPRRGVASHEQMCDFGIKGNVILTSTPKPS